MPGQTKLKYRQKGQAAPEEVGAKDLRREVEDRELQSASSKLRRGDVPATKKPKLLELPAPSGKDVDADEEEEELSDSDDEDDSDDDAELMAELERIKKERAAERAAKEEREQAEQEKIRHENILHGNPLLTPSGSQGGVDFTVKRRWDDDVIFKNCARGVDERKKEPRFINDAIRSDFHRKFMEKYIQ